MPRRFALLAAALLFAASAAPSRAADPEPKVRLVVLLVFDQMRGDYLARFGGAFGDGGFKRLSTDGAWFTDCHYPYATTCTGPGHAAVFTGAAAEKNGIINNEWYDRAAAASVNCATTDRYTLVPPKPAAKLDPTKPDAVAAKPKPHGTPDRLLSPTVGDALKAVYGDKCRVFGVSFKDRSAIFPAGHAADAAYWFSEGKFVTSSYYRETLPKWVEEFNAAGKAESYFGHDWERFSKTADYDALAGPDKVMAEGKGAAEGVEFPHPIVGGRGKDGALFATRKEAGLKYYDALYQSPFGNEVLLAFAEACVDAEKLGAHAAPDLLTISFSSNDAVGHTWGPDSQEVMDVTLRSDALVADLLKHLDATVGAGKYAVIVTADHGICPLPEVAAKKGLDAKRVSAVALLQGAEKHLRANFAPDEKDDPPVEKPKEPVPEDKLVPHEAKATRFVEAISAPWIYLNHRLLKAKGLTPAEAADELASHLRKQDGVRAVYTYAQLKDGKLDPADPFAAAVRLSFHPDRSGDVYVLLKPYHLLGGVTVGDKLVTGTTHGTPHEYDTHVPLLVYGPGVAGGKRAEKVTPLHAAAIAAHFLGVAPPKDAAYELPTTLAK